MAELEDAPWLTKSELPDAPWATSATPPPAKEEPAAPKNYSWSDVPGAALSNSGHSLVEFGKSMVQPVIHPIDTATNLKNLGLGVLEKAGSYTGLTNPGEHEKYAEAVGHHFKERYGGWDNVKRSMAEDPVGVLADLSLALTGAGAGVRAGAKGAELAGAAKTADVAGTIGRGLQTAGSYTDPINLAGKTVAAPFKLGPEQKMLEQAGVQMTPGQMMIGPKGVFKKLEDAASSIPVLGSFMKSGQERSIKSFNTAVGNQALEPIGQTVAKGAAGHEVIKDVGTKLGAAYDSLLPQIKFVPDAGFHTDWRNILATKVATLPPALAQQFHTIINQHLGPPAPMAGPMLKKVESELGYYAKNYSASPNPAQRQLGQAVGNVVTALRTNLERVNPAHSAELQAINNGWAMYARMRDAASRRATSAGIFTPSDLLQAVKNGDKTVGHGAFARGDALMQTFGEAAQKVLPSTLPTSGTSERIAAMGLFGGSAMGAAWLHNPALAAGIIGGAVPYTRVGMYALNKPARALVRNSTPWRAGANAAYRAGQNNQVNPYAP